MSLSRLRVRPIFVLLAMLGGALPASALAGDEGAWRFSVTPYLWLPSMSGSSKVRLPGLRGVANLRADTSPNSYLDDLDMAFMGMAEVRKGQWSAYTDLLYTSFGNKDTKVRSRSGPGGYLQTDISSKARTDLSATVWTLAGGYRALSYDFDRNDADLTLYGPGLGVGFRW
jgi:hypothetical protein